MTRPLLELADVAAAAGHRLIDRPPAWFTWLHLKVLGAIERCRTAALGGHLDHGRRMASTSAPTPETRFPCRGIRYRRPWQRQGRATG